MRPRLPHPAILAWLLMALPAGTGCDAGVVTAPALTAAGGDGGLPVDPDATDPGVDAREAFETQVLPRLETECGACHGDDGRGVGFLAPPDPYAGVLGWPGLVTPGDPTRSELVIHGRHTGPALSPEAQRVTESWILLEGASPDGPSAEDAGAGAADPTPDRGPGGDTAPTATFSVTTSDAAPLSLTFDASASYDPEGDLSLYQWDFGDGESAFGMAVTHSYAAADTYTVQLTVTDRAGESATATQAVEVGAADGTDLRVLSLALVDADADTDIDALSPLYDGAVLDRAALGTNNFSIRADTTDGAQSLRFSLDGVTDFHVENHVPYAIVGDSGGDYDAWTPEPGEHTVTATPFTEPDAGGLAGTPLTVTFTVL